MFSEKMFQGISFGSFAVRQKTHSGYLSLGNFVIRGECIRVKAIQDFCHSGKRIRENDRESPNKYTLIIIEPIYRIIRHNLGNQFGNWESKQCTNSFCQLRSCILEKMRQQQLVFGRQFHMYATFRRRRI